MQNLLFNSRRSALYFALLASIVAVLIPVAAFALDLDSAKSSGLVGETPSGYLEPVSSQPTAEVKALVNDINSQRKTHYVGIANKNGTSQNAVELLAGQKAIEITPAGQYYRLSDGAWRKK